MAGTLLVNPRSGNASPSVDEVCQAAHALGIETRPLEAGEDCAAAAREAGAGPLGIAGGDGSLAVVADVAIERDVPFVCVPFGTYNHFARDLGIERDDPIAALAAFAGEERRVDVARAGDRVFLNNLSLGDYAMLVHRRERHRRRSESFARLRALVVTVRRPRPLRVAIDGAPTSARIVLVSCNRYETSLPSLGERPDLDAGELVLYVAHGFLRRQVEDRAGTRFTLGSGERLRGALDGEPVVLHSPLEVTIEPRALRVLVPPRGDDLADVEGVLGR